MNKRFKPLMAAAFAAGLAPVADRMSNEAEAAPITAAGFTFENLGTGNLASAPVLSYSYAADVATGTVTLSHASGTIASVGGNPGKALTGNYMYGASYTFKFPIDDLTALAISFDTVGSATGPRDFRVLYSLDGTTFQSFTTFALSAQTVTATASAGTNTGTASTFASGSSASAWNLLFTAPLAFSDTATGIAGEMGYFQILQSGLTAINGGASSSSGTNRLDNVFITGTLVDVPEPATTAIVTLAAAAAAMRRRTTSR